MKDLKEITLKNLENENNKLKDDLNNKINEINNNNNIILNLKNEKEENNKIITKLNEKIKNLEQNIKTLENKKTEEIERLKFEHTLSLNELKVKLDGEISNLKIQNMKLKGNNEKNLEYENIINNLQKQLNKKDNELAKKGENLRQYQKEMYQKMKGDFMEAMNLLQQKNDNLTEEINELENYLTNRPSREEDLQQIQNLKFELNLKEQEISELRDGGSPKSNKIKLMSLKDKLPKYKNVNYGMIFSKK